MAKVGRTVQYRVLNREFANIGERKLDGILREALSHSRDGDVIGKKARARIADLNQSGQLTLWNGVQGNDAGTVLAGELVLYKQGFDVPAIEEKLDEGENRFQLVRFQTDGKSKPVEGTLYFAIIGDHVGIIQSNAVTGRWLERYFTWLLKDITNLMDGDNIVTLDAKVQLPDADLGKLGPAKSLSLHAESEERVPANTGTSQADREFKTKRKGKGATVVDILRLMGLGDDVIDSIKGDVPTGGSLEGDFLVYIKKGRKKEQISVGTLNHAFRNMPPEDIVVQRRGSATRNSLQTLSEPVRVQETLIGLDPNDAIGQVIDVLYRWSKQGVVNLGPPE